MSERFRQQRLRRPLGLLTAGLLIGCSPAVRLEPVVGVVTFEDGEALRGGVIEFSPASGDGLPARGRIGSEGRFRLSTQGRDGACSGVYRVAVVQPGEVAAGGRHSHRLIDPKFARFETSGLERRVESGMAELRISIQPAGASSRQNGQP